MMWQFLYDGLVGGPNHPATEMQAPHKGDVDFAAGNPAFARIRLPRHA
jgi:hypothetical protein